MALTDGIRPLDTVRPPVCHPSADPESRYMYERDGAGGGGEDGCDGRSLDSDASDDGEGTRSGGVRSIAGS